MSTTIDLKPANILNDSIYTTIGLYNQQPQQRYLIPFDQTDNIRNESWFKTISISMFTK